MERNTLASLWIGIGILALAASAAAKSAADDQVKRLAELYSQIDAQLNRSVHYLKKEESGGATTVEQAWLNGAGDPIKVAIERIDSSGRELTEYFARDLDDPFAGFNYEGTFLLNRKETKLPDGGTQVEESRKYFGESNGGNGRLIRELRKSARFKPGESTDTVHTPNVVVDLSKQPKDNRAEDDVFDQPEKVVDSLRKAGPPESDPFANVKGDSGKFRVIHGTASPDGRFAIALGLARNEIDWDGLAEKNYQEHGTTYYAENEEDVRNYVVDLASQKILGETGCNYFGTRRRYNHRSCVVTWSPDSTKFVQLWDDKWASQACVAGKINPGPKFAGAVDLDTAITKKTYAFVKKRFDSENGRGLALGIKSVSNDCVIDLEASEECSSGDCKGETIFSVREQLRLRDTPNGLRLDIVNMRRVPN
jgi:hypothetical protein